MDSSRFYVALPWPTTDFHKRYDSLLLTVCLCKGHGVRPTVQGPVIKSETKPFWPGRLLAVSFVLIVHDSTLDTVPLLSSADDALSAGEQQSGRLYMRETV